MEISKKKMYFGKIKQNKDSGIIYFEKSNFSKFLFNIYTDMEKRIETKWWKMCVCVYLYIYVAAIRIREHAFLFHNQPF